MRKSKRWFGTRCAWLFGAACWTVATASAMEPVTVQISDWNGYQKQSFTINGHSAYVVVPRVAAPGNPWVWRTSFPDYMPVVDLALVHDGYHIGYIEILDMLGSDSALDLVDQFYTQVRAQWGLAEKMAVEPCSRGGLPAYRYAARHPERVACIYGDVPVMDFKSWPYKRPEKTTEWPKIMRSYGFKDDAEAMAYPGNPIDQLAPIAKAKIPIRHVICLSDRVVPPEQNTLEAKRRLEKLGSSIEVVAVEKGSDTEGHHFPYPDVFGSIRFIMDHTDVLPAGHDYFQLRGSVANCRMKFEKEKTGRVVFLGSDGASKPGGRDEVRRYFRERFPKTQFDFIDAGNVLSHEPIDLLIVEAGDNDASTILDHPSQTLHALEGIIRHARAANPMTDIIQMDLALPQFIADYRSGKLPTAVAEQEKVAATYGCSSLNLAWEVTDRVQANEFTWGEALHDLGSSSLGQLIYANSIARMLDAAFAAPDSAIGPLPHTEPPSLDERAGTLPFFGKTQITDASPAKEDSLSTPAPPPQAVAAGYNRLAFDEEFSSFNGIDMSNTGKPGYNFYRRLPFGRVEPTNDLSISNGVLTINSQRHSYNLGLISICKNGSGWNGFTASGGAYFEASIRFDPTVSAHGWPSFWTMAAEHFYGGQNTNFLEIDFFEYDTLQYGQPQNTYGGAIHLWATSKVQSTNNQAHNRFLITAPPDTDWKNSFNTVGTLWAPGSHIDYYFNNTLTTDTNPYSLYPQLQPMDNQHMPVIIGSDGWPMKVDWVRVWQK